MNPSSSEMTQTRHIRTIISLEQALALPYATQRFVHLGWRVIRVEAPPVESAKAGDPNRYIGRNLGFEDLHSYYIAPNVGKESVTINLRDPRGHLLLRRLIHELQADVFMCNTLPGRYKTLGIDYPTLAAIRPDLIWCGISAMGPEHPFTAGYDPALQAMMGFTWLTGEEKGLPVPCGIPVIDLKAGDEAYCQTLAAMLNGGGSEIHISMAQCAASWLITALPQLSFVDSADELFRRSGSEHRSFIPCNAYPTSDGYAYIAIGNDLQWERFTAISGFESLSAEHRKHNAGRMQDKDSIYAEIGNITRQFTTDTIVKVCLASNIAVAPINSIAQVAAMDIVSSASIQTALPNGKQATLSPPSYTTDFLRNANFTLSCAPRLGEHNHSIFSSIGLSETEIADMTTQGVI